MQRISQSMMSSMFLKDMHSSLNRLMDVEKQMSSQQLYSKPSDNPAEVSRGMTVKNTISRNEQYMRNLDDAVTWLSNTETSLGQITDLISSIREQTIYAGDGSLSQTDREAIAQDIRAMRDELMQAANFNVGGQFLMGGLQTSKAPFLKNDEGDVLYQGDDNRISFEIEEGLTGCVSLNGRDVFPTSFLKRDVTSIEVPMGFTWESSSEVLQISVGNDSAQVMLPQRWFDHNTSNLADLSDYNSFASPGEEIMGYSLSEIAKLINANDGAGKLVHASVETDILSETEKLSIQSLSGEPLQVISLPWEGLQERGQFISSEAPGGGWNADSNGQISIVMDDNISYNIQISAGDTLKDVADSLAAVESLWVGVRDNGSIALVAENFSNPFSIIASGSATDLFGTDKISQAMIEPKEISHIGLSNYLGLATAVTSTEITSELGDTSLLTGQELDIVFQSSNNKLEINVNDDVHLTLEKLAEQIKAAAGDWLEVVVQQDPGRTDLTDSSVGDSEVGTKRLMIWPKDGSPLTIYDKQNDWAKILGIQTALSTVDLSNLVFPDTAGSEVPIRIGVEIDGDIHEVKLYQKDVVDTSTGFIDPKAMALKIREQVGSDKVGFDLTGWSTGFVLYSVTGEPLRIMDLPYSDPSFNRLSSGLAMSSGLQSGVASSWSSSASGKGSFVISSGSREVALSVSSGEDLQSVASRLEDLAGSWLDVSLASDASGQYRLALFPKDGSPINIYDVNGSAARDFNLNTDVRIEKGTWSGGDILSLSVDGYTHEMDLRDLSSLQEVADLVNTRFSEGDVHTRIADSGDLILYSPAGKDVHILGVPVGMNLPLGVVTTPDRGASNAPGPYNQNLAIRSGANVEEVDLFALLDDLAVAIEQGADKALSESFLPKLDKAMDEALQARSYCGALQKRYETASNRLGENSIAFNELYSNIMDVDIAEAAMEFQTAQTVYQATLATIAKAVQPTLVDYLT